MPICKGFHKEADGSVTLRSKVLEKVNSDWLSEHTSQDPQEAGCLLTRGIKLS
jgi:hypothetical protein